MEYFLLGERSQKVQMHEERQAMGRTFLGAFAGRMAAAVLSGPAPQGRGAIGAEGARDRAGARTAIFRTAYIAFCFGLTPLSSLAGGIGSSLEQYNYQIGASSLSVRSYDAFDEISGTAEFPGVAGLTVQVNDGPVDSIAFDAFYDAFKRRQSWGTVAEMVAARPTDATIIHTLQGSPAGSVTIMGPGIAYEDAIPISPLFSISGVSGYWTYTPGGEAVFNFDASVSSFTINLNTYVATTQGPHFFYGIAVGDVRGPFAWIDELHSGILAAGSPAMPLALTFTLGIPLDGGDTDPSTFGFAADSFFHVEAEFGNVFGLSDAGLGEGSEKAFIYQNNTSLKLRAASDVVGAVPEPSALALLFFGLAALGVSRRL